MNNLGRAFMQATNEIWSFVKYKAKYVAHDAAGFVAVVLPVAAVMIGESLGAQRCEVYFGKEVIAIALLQAAALYLKKVMNKLGCGNDVPVPRERFTSVDKYGEVTVDANKTQELLLYVADVEDYLERMGRLQ